jgi:hypothetical protein
MNSSTEFNIRRIKELQDKIVELQKEIQSLELQISCIKVVVERSNTIKNSTYH